MTRPGTDDPRGRVVPFCRRWHVIDEIDLVRLLAGHAELRTLCDLLEACADTLPVMPSPAQTTVLCQRLTVAIDRYARAGETLLEEMFRREADRPLAAALLARIRARHAIDDSSAQDLIAALDPESTEPDRFPPEMLGYMLRCFFDGCRRAMDFTELAILALGERRLTRDARALLIGSLARS